MIMQKDSENEYMACSEKDSYKIDEVNSSSVKVQSRPQPSSSFTSVSTSSTSSTSAGNSGRSKWYENSKELHPNFSPGPYDVICARGSVAWNHSGNKYFRSLVEDATDAYSKVSNKSERTVIVSSIVERVRSQGTGFVKYERGNKSTGDGRWIEVGDLLAREKVGQMLRNRLSSKYRSSHKSFKRRRRDVQVKRLDGLHNVMQTNSDIAQSMSSLKIIADQRHLSDEDMMALFAQEQAKMLQSIQADQALVQRFLQAESSSSRDVNDSDDTASNNSDGDIQMADAY